MQENTTLVQNNRTTQEQKRKKVIELELEDPISFKIFPSQGYEEQKEGKGEILTFNENGILLLTDNTLNEGSFINLSINFKGLGPLEDILGKVKRVEESEEHDFYVGVELYSPDQIKAEALSCLFPEKIESFEAKLKNSLLDYFRKNKRDQGEKELD